MFERFESVFRLDTPLLREPTNVAVKEPNDSPVQELFSRFGGASFNGGLYRIMTAAVILSADAFVAHAFPNFRKTAACFSYDWLGRIFALDSDRLERGSPAVVMFEPGTAQALQISRNLLTFHEDELVDYSEAALAVRFHNEWLEAGVPSPKVSQCVGYKKPLFLGGRDSVENLGISDLTVYWELCGQLIQMTRGLASGTRIGKVTMRDE